MYVGKERKYLQDKCIESEMMEILNDAKREKWRETKGNLNHPTKVYREGIKQNTQIIQPREKEIKEILTDTKKEKRRKTRKMLSQATKVYRERIHGNTHTTKVYRERINVHTQCHN